MASWLHRREIVLAPVLVLVLFLLNLCVATRVPYGAWMDEVTYVDPGLNFADGKGWVSSAWPWQTDREFWAANSPLFPAGLALWAQVFGTSMFSARAYCHFLFAVATLVLWWGTYRLDLLGSARRLFWIIFLTTGSAMDWMGRNERYDVWIYLGLAVAWLGLSLPRAWQRCAMVFAGCLIVPFAGFVGAPYIALMAALGLVFAGWRFWPEAVAAVAGAGAGVGGVLAFYASRGALGAFRSTIEGETMISHEYQSPLKVFLYPFDDPGPPLMIVVLVLLTTVLWEENPPTALRWLLFGWAVLILMPFVMLLRGSFTMMYFYLVIIPVSLAILQLSALKPQPRWLPPVTVVLLAVLCFTGLPVRAYYAITEWNFRDPQQMTDFVGQYVQPSDHVYADFPFYYPLRERAAFVATPEYLGVIPPDEAAQITVALVRDTACLQTFGGQWQAVAVFPTPEMQSRYAHAIYSGLTYTLYRRVTPQP